MITNKLVKCAYVGFTNMELGKTYFACYETEGDYYVMGIHPVNSVPFAKYHFTQVQ